MAAISQKIGGGVGWVGGGGMAVVVTAAPISGMVVTAAQMTNSPMVTAKNWLYV